MRGVWEIFNEAIPPGRRAVRIPVDEMVRRCETDAGSIDRDALIERVTRPPAVERQSPVAVVYDKEGDTFVIARVDER